MEDDPFAGFSDLSQDDFRVLDAATQFMSIGSASNNKTGDINGAVEDELQRLRAELAATKQKAEALERNFLNMQQEKMTREGEVSILRERLNRVEKDRSDMLNRSNERLHQSEQSRQAIEEDFRRATEALKSELAFKDQELESLTSKMDFMRISSKTNPTGPAKERRVEPIGVPEGFETLAKKRTSPTLIPCPIEEPPITTALTKTKERASIMSQHMTEAEILDMAIRSVDAIKDINRFLKHDYEEILKRRDQMHRVLRETRSLLATLEIMYDGAVKWLRQVVFLYFARLVTSVFMIQPQLARDAYSRSQFPFPITFDGSEYKSSQMIPKMCAFLNDPPFGLHPLVFKTHLDAFKCMLLNATNMIPLELKDLLESGFFVKSFVNIEKNSAYRGICSDCTDLLQLMICDRNAVSLMLRPSSKSGEASLMAVLVKSAIERMRDGIGRPDKFILSLTELLLHLGKKNILPINVAFDKRFLRELNRYFGQQLRMKLIRFKRMDEYEVFIRSLHFVFVERNVDLEETILGGYFSLHSICQIILESGHSFDNGFRKQLEDLSRVTERKIQEWIVERDGSKIDMTGMPEINLEF